MNRMFRTSVALALVLFALASLSACSSGKDDEAQAQAARDARLGELQQQKQQLDTARQELAQMRDQLAKAENGAPAEGETEGETVDVDQLQTQVNQKEAKVAEMADNLNQALVEYINAGAPVEGQPVPEDEQKALAMKSDEDMVLAKEYITEGGEYARAIDIYNAILKFDPDNQKVKQALAEAEADRYMDKERFSQVKKGMTQSQVSELLGPATSPNRRDYPEKNVVAWYYPKSPQGDAAAVWMRKKDDRYEVYATQFDAVAKRSETGGEAPGT